MEKISTETARIVALCERLAQATVARHAHWASEGEDRYVWQQPEGAVAVGSRDRDGDPPYQLGIRNADGALVDELESDLAEDDQPAPWNASLAELYRVARRSALGADNVIDALMDALPLLETEQLAARDS
jgi:hypothetical protein